MRKPKAFVVYQTKTGNTRKVAEAIAGELDAEACPVAKAGKLPDGALLVAGSGVYGSKAGKEMERWLGSLPPMKGRKVALFETTGSSGGAVEDMRRVVEGEGAEVVGSLSCRGSVLFLLMNRGRPGEQDLDRARAFARSLRAGRGGR